MSSDGGRVRPPRSGLGSSFKWKTTPGERGGRLDRAVSAYLRINLAEAAALVDFGSVYVQGRVERNPSRILSGDEQISVAIPAYGPRKFYEIDPGRILFRDRHLLAYDKEAGIPSQQTPSDAYNNVFAALLRFLSPGGAKPYAALHHRLDRETSGVILFGLDRGVNAALGRSFQAGLVRKEYLALVEGSPAADSWSSEREIGKVGGKYCAVPTGQGKTARTSFEVLRRERDFAVVLARPATGRTHQIRIHLAEGGHPVAGDRAYGAKPAPRLYLHAMRLSLKHPALGTVLVLEAPVPPDWP